MYVLADDSSRFVPVWSAQERRQPSSPDGIVSVERIERSEIGDDELAGEDWDCGGRLGEESFGRFDSAVVASAEAESRF